MRVNLKFIVFRKEPVDRKRKKQNKSSVSLTSFETLLLPAAEICSSFLQTTIRVRATGAKHILGSIHS